MYLPHDIILQPGIVDLSFKTQRIVLEGQTVVGLTVFCVAHLPHDKLQAGVVNQWILLNGQSVGGLTVYCVDAFTT